MAAKRKPRQGDWDVEWRGIWTHVSDRTRGQAVAEVLRRIYDAGYQRRDVRFPDLRVKRCVVAGTLWCNAHRYQPEPYAPGGEA
jgi:hypothetical protein